MTRKSKATPNRRINWQDERERINLAAVATGLLGQPPGRTRERGRRLWWRCPFHEDRNPSFMVEPGKPWWKCWGCGEHGDAATLIMKLEYVSFPEAVARLTGRSFPSGTTSPRPSRKARPERKLPEGSAGPKGLPEAEALALVVDAESQIWMPEGSEALAYLTGKRFLTLGTIRAARLGWTPGVRIPSRDGGTYSARGIVIPWFDGDRLALVKIRQPEGVKPKYAEAFRDSPSFYPDRRAIRQGRPLVLAEGEFDTLLLGQELADLAAVVTLGGTGSSKPEPAILGRMIYAMPWLIGFDADDAGDRAAARWEGTRAHRVRPPDPFKDWTHARQGKMSLRRWWADRLGGNPTPKLFTWEELAEQRWTPAEPDSEPGIIID